MHGSTSSSDNILNEATGVEPGCVEIMPLNLVTLHVLTWLYSLHTDTRNFSDSVTYIKLNKDLKIVLGTKKYICNFQINK